MRHLSHGVKGHTRLRPTTGVDPISNTPGVSFCPGVVRDSGPFLVENRAHQTVVQVFAFILEKEVIERILHHIGEDTIPPRVLPARSPPQREMPFAQTAGPVTWLEMNQTTEFPDDEVCPVAAAVANPTEIGLGFCPPAGAIWPPSAAAASTRGAKSS
jgi:hypothetical protein